MPLGAGIGALAPGWWKLHPGSAAETPGCGAGGSGVVASGCHGAVGAHGEQPWEFVSKQSVAAQSRRSSAETQLSWKGKTQLRHS